MLRWAAIFFVIAIIAALLGFTGVAGGGAQIAELLFLSFFVSFFFFLLLRLYFCSSPATRPFCRQEIIATRFGSTRGLSTAWIRPARRPKLKRSALSEC